MAISKICNRCRTKYPVGTQCPNGCYVKAKKESNKFYDKYQRKNKDIYHSKQWELIRKECLSNYDSLCLYTLFKYDKAVPATMIHHIIEINADPSKAYDIENLIPLSDEAHREVHHRYNIEDIKEVQQELKKFKRLYIEKYLEG